MNRLLETAVRAAVEAGQAIMEIYARDFAVSYKDDKSPLTDADQAANAIIMKHLAGLSIPIISEENKQLSYAERKDWGRCWIVDPLDGTKEFIKKNGEFTVNIALAHNNAPVLGVIYVPATKVLYTGDAETGKAQKVVIPDGFDEDAVALLAKASPIAPKQDADTLRIVGSRSHMSPETEAFVEAQRKHTDKAIEIVSKGSSLKLCLVAEGQADIYPRLAPTMEWDTAAGHAICKAAGLTVVDWDTKKEMTYNKENLLNPFFLVSNQ